MGRHPGVSGEGGSTTSLGSLFQCLCYPERKEFLPQVEVTFLVFIALLGTTEKRLPPSTHF